MAFMTFMSQYMTTNYYFEKQNIPQKSKMHPKTNAHWNKQVKEVNEFFRLHFPPKEPNPIWSLFVKFSTTKKSEKGN